MAGMTMTEKILAKGAGRERVTPGEIVITRLNYVMSTDVTTPLSVEIFDKIGAERVFDPEKIILVNDHFVPAKDIKAAMLSKTMREFAKRYNIKHYYEVGRSGICHTLLVNSGLIKPSDIIIGADSHTCTYGAIGAFATGAGSTDIAAAWVTGKTWFRIPPTLRFIIENDPKSMVTGKDLILYIINKIGVDGARYKAMEFVDHTTSGIPLVDRVTLCNMAIEAGAKNGIIEPSEEVIDFLKEKGVNDPVITRSDNDAVYEQEYVIDYHEIDPLVAKPYLPENTEPAYNLKNVKVDQVVIGSCTNGRFEDFQRAWEILQKGDIAPWLRLIIIPGDTETYLKLAKEGLIEAFVSKGAVISPPTCGPCIGGHMGILGEDEVGVFTTNRNFVGRNGARSAKVYLASPYTAAATALKGYITDPRDV